MSDKIEDIRARHEEGIRAGANEDRAFLLDEVDRRGAEIEWQRAEIERLKQEPELLRAELISLTNAARKALADAYNRARETRDAFIEWRNVR